jgi:hypothetical protein
MRIYADEDLDRRIVDHLRQGHDVWFVTETEHRRKPDVWHLNRAAMDGRVLLTFNEHDYRFLHRVWTTSWVAGAFERPHGGIVTTTRRLVPGDWIPALDALLTSGEGLVGRMMIWHHVALQWDEDAWRPER